MMRQSLILAIALVLSACRTPSSPVYCTDELRFGVQLTVRDSSTLAAPDSASAGIVSIREGTFLDTLRFAGADASAARFVHDAERAGTYVVRVEIPGYRAWERGGVRVEPGVCHVTPAVVSALVQRS